MYKGKGKNTQKSQAICPRSHCWQKAELGPSRQTHGMVYTFTLQHRMGSLHERCPFFLWKRGKDSRSQSAGPSNHTSRHFGTRVACYDRTLA